MGSPRFGAGTSAPDTIPTVNGAPLVDGYLASHEVDEATTKKLRYELAHAKREFGSRRIDELRPLELPTWRSTLPARTRHQPFGSFKAVLEQAVTLGLLQTNPAARIKNRRVKLGRGSWESGRSRRGTTSRRSAAS